MWPIIFDQRLSEWYSLRTNSTNTELEPFLHQVNTWWWRAPMVGRYLTWENYQTWPGPWDLLADNRFCELARAVGIVYTLLLCGHREIENISLTQANKDNLVLINHGKYILNWAPRELLNIDSTQIAITRQLSGEQLKQNLGYNT